MSSCCPPTPKASATGTFFSRRSNWYARSFRKGKLESIQRLLINEICKESLDGKTILDIGSGVGKLHLTLLQRGAAFATGVDMSEAMIDHARTFGRKFGVEQKTAYMIGDFMSAADSLPSADVTLLDKVICCYDNIDGLIKRSAEKTHSIYALIYPSDTMLVRLIFAIQIAFAVLFRSEFRPYWHQWSAIPQQLEHCQFTLSYTASSLLWRTDVYRRN